MFNKLFNEACGLKYCKMRSSPESKFCENIKKSFEVTLTGPSLKRIKTWLDAETYIHRMKYYRELRRDFVMT